MRLYDNATLKASHPSASQQTAGKVGLGTRNAIGQFDNCTVAALAGSSSSPSSATIVLTSAMAIAHSGSSDRSELPAVDLLNETSLG